MSNMIKKVCANCEHYSVSSKKCKLIEHLYVWKWCKKDFTWATPPKTPDSQGNIIKKVKSE